MPVTTTIFPGTRTRNNYSATPCEEFTHGLMMSSEDFFDHIKNLLTELESPSSTSNLHGTLKSLYRIIKKYSIQVSNPSALSDKDYQTLLSLIKSLVLVLLENDISTDIMLLCGTCFVVLVTSMFNTEFASSFLMYIYCQFDEKYSGNQTLPCIQLIEDIKSFFRDYESCIAVGFKMFKNYSETVRNSSNLRTPSFQQITILNGIVSCQAIELYSFPLHLFHKKPFLIVVFDAVYQCCLTPHIHQYHAFIVLLNWIRMCEMCVDKFQTNDNVFFATNNDIVQKLLNLLESNWQSPIKGVNGLLRELYKSIIKVNEIESRNVHSNDIRLISYLLEKTMMLSWQVKGKYFLLSVILQNMDNIKFLNENPDAPTKIIFSLKANYISSSVAEVYKVIVNNMKKFNFDEQFYVEWCKWWRDPILNSLKSNDRLLIQNVTNNILSWTMKQFSKSYDLMMETENHNSNDSVKLLLLRVAKENFPFTLNDKELTLIEKNLHHRDIQIRSEVLSILCSSSKKSEAVNSIELEYIKSFILENLNIDSAPFHHYLLSQLHTLLIRIRDSLTQEFRSKIQIDECSIDMTQAKFVDWLFYSAIQNTFPGACFQRRRFCLQLLNIIYDVFIKSTMIYRRKENPSKSVEKVIKWVQKNDLWLFFENDRLTYILPCITDFADEVRSLCANLLCSYTSWPTLENDAVSEATITKCALTLCNHPDYRNNDGGARICCIIFNRLYHQTELKESLQALEFLKYLLSVCRFQLETSKEDFLFAAMQKPIHGILLALQYCLADSKNFFINSYQHQKVETFDLLKDLMHLCFSIVDFMLKVMKGKNENYYCPSFSDIGKAMEDLVLSQKNSSSAKYESLLNECENENSNSTVLCDLLLSCCWHSVKNSCFLLCELSSLILAVDIHSTEKKKFLSEISEKLSSILIDCRHRGVVEACCGALNNFCINLLKDKVIYEDITLELLKRVFDNLTDSSKVSVTRRSAGLPLLFQAVVSSEGNNNKRQLLPYTINNLLSLINQPLPSPDLLSEKTDLPQAHAYHILKALVSEARLSQSILPYFDSVIPICITGFSSPIWSVRNGALQLFGVILPRVCGQKKVRDDDSEHNTVSAFELFARCPSLKTYLLKELAKCVKFHHDKRLCSELVPILSLLVKLMPEREDQRQYMMEFTPLLLELLDIPVWKVRDLVTSALAVLMHSSDILNLLKEALHILKNEIVFTNKIHSLLLIVQNFMRRNNDNILSNMSFIEEHLKAVYILSQDEWNCPLLLGTILDMVLLLSEAKNDYSVLEFMDNATIDRITSGKNEIGILFYGSKIVLSDLKRSKLQSLPLYLRNISSKNKNIKLVCLQFLSDKLKYEKTAEYFYTEANLKLWKEIFVSILEYILPKEHPSVILEALKFMINLCNDEVTGKAILDSINNTVMGHLECHLDFDSGLSISAYAFTMWSICLKHLLINPVENVLEYIIKWNLLFCTYCQPRSNDILRFQAAISLVVVGPSLIKHLENKIPKGSDKVIYAFIDICEGSLLLLQDEDEDIRYEACKFPSQIPNNFIADELQFNIGIQIIFHCMLQVLKSESFYILYLWNRFQNYPSTVKILQSHSTEKKRNLFEQEYVNVFFEPHQLLVHHYFNFKEILSDLHKKNYKLYHENISMFICDLEMEIQDVKCFLSSVKTENSNFTFAFHHQIYLSLKKIRFQVEVLLNQKLSILAEDPLHIKLTRLKDDWNIIEKLLPSSISSFLNVL